MANVLDKVARLFRRKCYRNSLPLIVRCILLSRSCLAQNVVLQKVCCRQILPARIDHLKELDKPSLRRVVNKNSEV